MEIRRRFKKSAIGASSVTLVPTTAADPENSPNHQPVSQLVASTNGATPPADFWGTAAADGAEYEVFIRRVS